MKFKLFTKRCAIPMGCIMAVLPSAMTVAQDSSSNGLQLEEVVVSAQRREENLQEIPIAISALGTEAIEVYGVTDTNSFSNFVPNLHIKQGTTGSTTITIRGIGNNNAGNPTYQNTVGMYTDGVYVGKAAGSLFDFGDIERIEVLRGPQGTLYGRNTIGGAINVISTPPADEFGAELMVGVGNENMLYTRGNLDTGELGNVRARFSFFTRERDGIVDNVFRDPTGTGAPITTEQDRFGDIDRDGFRVALDWTPFEFLDLGYTYTESNSDDTGRIFQVLDIDNTAARPRPPGFEGYLSDGRPTEAATNEAFLYDVEIALHTLTANWFISDAVTLKSITSYRELDTQENQDLDSTNTNFFEGHALYDGEDRSQEIQLQGHTDNLNYIVGLYYSEEDLDHYRTVQFTPTFGRTRSAFIENNSKAVFGQVDWSLNNWVLTAGARYTKEEKAFGRFLGLSGGGLDLDLESTADPELGSPPRLDFDDTSILLSAMYKITDDINVYVKYAEGFRSGGYDGASTTYESANIPFESEELETMEIGFKSRTLDDRLELNLAAFWTDYSNIQLASFSEDLVAATLNAGGTDTWGAELETVFLLTSSLRVTANMSYLDYDFDEFDLGPVIGDVSDEAELNNAPKFTANITLSYVAKTVVFGGELAAYVNYNYSDEAHAIAIKSNGDAPNSAFDSRGLWDARLTLSDIAVGESAILKFSLWGKNIFDKEYVDNIIDFTSWRGGTYGPERSYGLEATVSF